MNLRIDSHALERAQERGVTENEIRDVLETGYPLQAKYSRLGKAKVFPFNESRLGKLYEQKRVEVIYALEGDTMTVVTVYVFYGKWKEEQ